MLIFLKIFEFKKLGVGKGRKAILSPKVCPPPATPPGFPVGKLWLSCSLLGNHLCLQDAEHRAVLTSCGSGTNGKSAGNVPGQGGFSLGPSSPAVRERVNGVCPQAHVQHEQSMTYMLIAHLGCHFSFCVLCQIFSPRSCGLRVSEKVCHCT